MTGRWVWGASWRLQAQALSPPAPQFPRVLSSGSPCRGDTECRPPSTRPLKPRFAGAQGPETGWQAVCGQESCRAPKPKSHGDLQTGLCGSRWPAGQPAAGATELRGCCPSAKVPRLSCRGSAFSGSWGLLRAPLHSTPREALSLGAKLWDWPLCSAAGLGVTGSCCPDLCPGHQLKARGRDNRIQPAKHLGVAARAPPNTRWNTAGRRAPQALELGLISQGVISA